MLTVLLANVFYVHSVLCYWSQYYGIQNYSSQRHRTCCVTGRVALRNVSCYSAYNIMFSYYCVMERVVSLILLRYRTCCVSERVVLHVMSCSELVVIQSMWFCIACRVTARVMLHGVLY